MKSRIVQGFEGFLDDIERRVADFDHAAALETARLVASRQRTGRPRGDRDSMIAGIAVSRHATLATRNIRHFDDLAAEVINPCAARR
jgi:predicted nucleic acid-binding protein